MNGKSRWRRSKYVAIIITQTIVPRYKMLLFICLFVWFLRYVYLTVGILSTGDLPETAERWFGELFGICRILRSDTHVVISAILGLRKFAVCGLWGGGVISGVILRSMGICTWVLNRVHYNKQIMYRIIKWISWSQKGIKVTLVITSKILQTRNSNKLCVQTKD